MPSGLALAVLTCLAIASSYVGALYIWGRSLPRDHPTTIKRRLLSVVLVCGVSWAPVYFWATRLHGAPTPVHQLLGLRLKKLPVAILDSLLLVATLFAGPLLYFLYTLELPESHSTPPIMQTRGPTNAKSLNCNIKDANNDDQSGGSSSDYLDRDGDPDGETADGAAGRLSNAQAFATSTCRLRRSGASEGQRSSEPCVPAVGGGGGRNLGDRAVYAAGAPPSSWLHSATSSQSLVLWRNLVVAPLSEEFVFRSCMVPLLVLEGLSFQNVVFLTPLFFGAAHLHHVIHLLRHQQVPLGRAVATASFQFLYTMVFGWLATFLFLRTGHLMAAAAAHIFCNWIGFPPFADMMAHPRCVQLMLTTVAGVTAFFMLLPRLTVPEKYQQDYCFYCH
ncbi:hypothetical protein VaNZ11_002715 [Volvox africanus]|uniref:intramembrane prenyl-peptidase Rce1 n=1 Tax=Volvox africanus TaxID=51714 RepID=A0ABQ5RSH5_9CHLO|nr:hypothetical protein VaNZ11_002715 [Volvox africanus]